MLRTRGFLELSAPALLPLLRSDRLCVDECELVLAARSWARVGAVNEGPGAGWRGLGAGTPNSEGGCVCICRRCWRGRWLKWQLLWCEN